MKSDYIRVWVLEILEIKKCEILKPFVNNQGVLYLYNRQVNEFLLNVGGRPEASNT